MEPTVTQTFSTQTACPKMKSTASATLTPSSPSAQLCRLSPVMDISRETLDTSDSCINPRGSPHRFII